MGTLRPVKPTFFFLSLIAVAVASVTLTLYINNLLQEDKTLINESVSNIDGFLTNEKSINGLYNSMDLYDADGVFRYVFSKLDDEIFIYPTENYYYFTFPANGKVMWGSLHLPAYRLDEGELGFGYIERGNDVQATNRVGGSADYTSENGLLIKKINDFNYSITFENRTVLFRLNDLKPKPPKKAKLTSQEIFVEPTFDESGMRFYLIFNNATKHLYWVLNEEDYVPETFTILAEDLLIGDRTGFAFYVDEKNNRKILVGVYGLNVMWNNWYDGPFDQLLDNYVYTGEIDIQKYLEASYPNVAGRIDKYGRYLEDDMRGMRVAVSPYSTYFYKDDIISIVAPCRDSKTQDEFYTCITKENHDSLLNPPYPGRAGTSGSTYAPTSQAHIEQGEDRTKWAHAGTAEFQAATNFVHIPEGKEQSNFTHVGTPESVYAPTAKMHMEKGEDKTKWAHAGTKELVE